MQQLEPAIVNGRARQRSKQAETRPSQSQLTYKDTTRIYDCACFEFKYIYF